MAQDFLSNTELYYTPKELISHETLIFEGNEYHHISNVMRHRIQDEIRVTDGCGTIYTSVISNITKQQILCNVKSKKIQLNRLKKILFCIPVIKSNERFEFALEKAVELGITQFIVYKAERGTAKNFRIERWNKTVLSAMKQSLRSFLPKIKESKTLADINKHVGTKIVFEQNSKQSFKDFVEMEKQKMLNASEENYNFIFGPEGGLSEEEINSVKDGIKLRLTKNRLRTETAIVTAASILATG